MHISSMNKPILVLQLFYAGTRKLEIRSRRRLSREHRNQYEGVVEGNHHFGYPGIKGIPGT